MLEEVLRSICAAFLARRARPWLTPLDTRIDCVADALLARRGIIGVFTLLGDVPRNKGAAFVTARRIGPLTTLSTGGEESTSRAHATLTRFWMGVLTTLEHFLRGFPATLGAPRRGLIFTTQQALFVFGT